MVIIGLKLSVYIPLSLCSSWSILAQLLADYDSLGDGLIVMERVGPGPGRLPLDDGHLHVLDLDADQQEVDLSDDDVFQMVPGKRPF